MVSTYLFEIRPSKFEIQTSVDQSETSESEKDKQNSFQRNGFAYSVSIEAVERSVRRYSMLWCWHQCARKTCQSEKALTMVSLEFELPMHVQPVLKI